ncbi:MAG: peptide chain release factor N(5)-glutamine methyltransferase [Gammaproteobacteria bacterium]|nr:peptide chain release factor N(5)-glutamine methyltransferase [Gammaproteobacteria bacterium]
MQAAPTLASWTHWASAQLANSDSPRLDCELLLCHVLHKDRTYLRTWPEQSLTADQLQQLAELLDRRQQGEPIAYLLGEQAFWTLTLHVSPAVLIPRPETELFIETALQLLSPQQSYRLADLGTGSGAIALALASEFTHSQVIAGDFSAAAVAIAEHNRQQLQLDNCGIRLGSWFEIFTDETFDLIASNPPYIDQHDPHLQTSVRHYEPASALFSDQQGFADLEFIIRTAPNYLNHNGWLLLEHGWQQAPEVRQLMLQNQFGEVASIKDLAGHERLTLGKKP